MRCNRRQRYPPSAHLRRLARHRHHPHRVLWVVLRLGARQQVYGICLRQAEQRRSKAMSGRARHRCYTKRLDGMGSQLTCAWKRVGA